MKYMKEVPGSFLETVLCVCLPASAQALQDPGVYGVIQSGDHKGRTCVVKWIKLNSSSDDVEVSQENKTSVCALLDGLSVCECVGEGEKIKLSVVTIVTSQFSTYNQ